MIFYSKVNSLGCIKDDVLITFLNPYSYLFARKNPDLFNRFDLIFIDGVMLVVFLRIFNFVKVGRASFDMTSLASVVFQDSIKNNKSIYLIGAKPGEINAAINNICKYFPGVNFVGFRDGYFDCVDERARVIEAIRDLSPDVVICGMGTPLQEQFLVDLKDAGWKGAGYTCGGFLHQAAQRLEYFPPWSNRFNLRWVYRMYKEPVVIKRILFYYPCFIILFLYDYFKLKLRG